MNHYGPDSSEMRYRPSTFHEKSDAPGQMGRNLRVPGSFRSATDPSVRAALTERLFLDEVIFLISDARSLPHSPLFSGKERRTSEQQPIGHLLLAAESNKKVRRKGNEEVLMMTWPGNGLNTSLVKHNSGVEAEIMTSSTVIFVMGGFGC